MAVRTLVIDPVHSTVEFAITYAMNTIIKGQFREFDGEINLDTEDPTDSHVTATMNARSLDTGAENRDNHVKGEDFFDVDTHEDLSFESSSVDVVGEHHWQVHGDLTILGMTRPVTLDTHYYGIVEDATGTTRAGFVAETDITRSDWGMDWNAEQDTGVLVSDRVRISLYISATPVEDESDINEEDSE